CSHTSPSKGSMTFRLRISYKAPSKESMFLGAGWEPPRDVRGVYISGAAAYLHIENWALSQKFPSKLSLGFSMSHRSEVDAMVVVAAGVFGRCQAIVGKHKDASLVIWPLFRDPVRNFVMVLLKPTFGPTASIPMSPGTSDLIALDELQVSR